MLQRTHISVCDYIFPTSLVVLVSWGLCRAFITIKWSDSFFFFFFFPPFLLSSDFETSPVTQPFDFLFIPGAQVLSAHSSSYFSEAGLVL